ncbi:sugar ABC transporter ATP-binding protein [soil metagenome]
MIELRHIGKQFPGVRALHDVTLAIRPGEVLGLVGENGAGKSTLIKILGGVYEVGSFEGEVVIDGVVQAFASTLEAREAKIAIVHQELALVPDLSIAENLMLGREPSRWGIGDQAMLEAHAKKMLAPVLGEQTSELDFSAPVSELSIAMRQTLEIARALADRASVIVLDEPTAPLTEREIERLFELIRTRRAGGDAFVYISHRLEEIAALCDRVAVLQDGELVAVVSPEVDLVPLMTGSAIHDVKRARTSAGADHVLEVKHLTVAHPTLAGRNVVDDLSFTVAAGEVVALAGAMGSGRTATLSALFGCATRGSTGTVTVDGKLAAVASPRDAIAAGIAYVPEDRKAMGLVLGLSVAENLEMANLDQLSTLGVVDAAKAEHAALGRVREMAIKAPALTTEVATLSGGNQQKIVIGKWLELAPRVLLLDEPTRGVDVGAKAEIYALVEQLTAKGHAVVLASSDLPEVVRLADHAIVLREGHAVGELTGPDITLLAIMELAVGRKLEVHGEART